MEKSPYECTYYGKNLAELTDSEMMDCPGPGCVTCECCDEDTDAET